MTMSKISAELLDAKHGKKLACLTLDNERALNAADDEMVRAISAYLDEWAQDNQVAMVLLRGRGERAFCAGGDIRSLYHLLANSTDTQVDARIAGFFRDEYTLNYRMHTYAKPILVWGSGIVMGGGLGLLAGASHKVVTDSTLMAMPEVSIGLFPDAGGSYFLNRMWGKIGLFLGLTGARFFAADAKLLGLGDCAMAAHDFDKLMTALLAGDWTDRVPKNHGVLSAILNTLDDESVLSPSVLTQQKDIHRLMNAGDLLAVDRALRACVLDSSCPEYIKTAAESYAAGSPMTHALTWAIYHKVKHWSLKEILALEYNVALNCCHYGDFAEGVRALLIDKDKNPQWRHQLQDISSAEIARYFSKIDDAPHPFVGWAAVGESPF